MKNKLPYKIIVAFFLITGDLFAAGNVSTEKQIITVQPYKHLTYGAFYKSLSLYSEELPLESISGFDYHWGFVYVMEVEIVKITNPPADASDTEYRFSKLISKTPVAKDYTFNVRFETDRMLGPGTRDPAFVQLEKNLWLYLGELQVMIPDNLESQFERFLQSEKPMEATLKWNNGKGILVDLK